jgi:hypothetical protein
MATIPVLPRVRSHHIQRCASAPLFGSGLCLVPGEFGVLMQVEIERVPQDIASLFDDGLRVGKGSE